MSAVVPPPPQPAGPHQGGSAFFGVFPSIVIPIFIAVVDQTIVATALPTIAGYFGESDRIAWIVTSYLVAATIAAPIYGRLGDLLGRRRLMFVGLAIVSAAAVICAYSVSLEMLIAGRILQGFGGGGLMVLAQSLISESVPTRSRAQYQGFVATTAIISGAVGPVLGGLLTEHFGWQAVFLINLPLSGLAALLVFRLKQPAERPQRAAFDFPGLIFFAVMIIAALIALQHVQALTSSATAFALGCFLLAALAAVLLAVRELRAKSPLFPLELLRHSAVWRCDLMALCHGVVYVSTLTFLPIYLHSVRGLPPGDTGVLLLFVTLGVGSGSIITGRLVTRTGYAALFPSIGLSAVTVLLLFVAWQLPHLSEPGIGATFGILALGVGSVMSVVQVVVQIAAGPTMLGAGAGTVQLSRTLGASIGTATSSLVLFATVRLSNPDAGNVFDRMIAVGPPALSGMDPAARQAAMAAYNLGFQMIFAMLAAFALIALACALSLPIRRL